MKRIWKFCFRFSIFFERFIYVTIDENNCRSLCTLCKGRGESSALDIACFFGGYTWCISNPLLNSGPLMLIETSSLQRFKKTHEFSPACTLSFQKPSPLHPHRRIFSVKFMMLTNNEINLSCSSLSISIMQSLTDNAMRCVVEEEKKLYMRRISEVRSRVLDGVVSLIHDTSWSADRKKHFFLIDATI